MTRGFTLVELALILVIIALMIGAVLVGRDMVHWSTLRRAAGQLHEVTTAIGAFRLKYGGLPGDIAGAGTLWAGAVEGNGNGIIEGHLGCAPCDELEAYNAWHHLYLAGMVAKPFAAVSTDPPPDPDYSLEGALAGSFLNLVHDAPLTQLASTGHYLTLSMVAAPVTAPGFLGLIITNEPAGIPTGIYPEHARQIDAKLDDGQPLSGRIVSALPAMGSDELSCVELSGANAYNVLAEEWTCGLWSAVGQ
ncbi:MAG: hypothetical protein M5U20_05705 [Phycisphaerales bacterium]|nr:hypothetical protein [Phycisphaerales bacterium]